MIEAKLLAGRYLDLVTAPSRAPMGTPAAYIPVVCPPLQIQESHRKNPGGAMNPFRNVGGKRESTVLPGANANKVHRNFKWLLWYQGDIAKTDLTCDVLTGPMSGCILVSYRSATGVTMVGHIGTITVTESMPATINTNVKAVWTTFATAHPTRVIGGFNPVGVTVPMHPPAQPGDVGGQTWGLFTSTGEYYAVPGFCSERKYE
jgi:hypothetical protein